MTQRIGGYGIVAIVVLFAVLHLGFSQPEAGGGVAVATLAGGTAYLLMATSIFLATRPRFLEDAFGGLDRMYRAHKISGVIAGLLVLVHFFLAPKDLPAGAGAEISLAPSSPLGMLSLIALMVLLAMTLNRKIAYHRWRLPHKAMGVVFILVTGHFLTAPDIFVDRFGPSGVMLMAAAVIGIVSWVANLFGLSRRSGRRFVIEAVNHLERATELVLKPMAGGLAFRPGQFAFVEVRDAAFSEPHPFTIASDPKDDRLRFVVKVLGDWTRKVREDLKPGVEIAVHGPYGRFDSTAVGPKQVWLAGGIGITPFLSMLRDMEPGDDREIVLVYAVRETKEAVFLDEIRERAATLGNVKVVLLQSNLGEFVRVDMMKTKLAEPLPGYEFFLCGPKPMVNGLVRDLGRAKVPRARIHTEAFELR